MIAKICSKNNVVYDSAVFAVNWDGFKTTVIAFDETGENLVSIKMYDNSYRKGLVRKVFIFNIDNINDIKNSLVGVGFILNNERIIKQIKTNKLIKYVGEDILSKCKEIQNSIQVKEWNDVNTNLDVESLYLSAGGFHDSNITDFHKTNESELIVRFTSSWSCIIDMHFFEVDEYNIIDNDDGMEFDIGTVFFEDGFIYWVDGEIDSSSEITEEFTYFKAKRIRWKLILE